MSPTCTVMREFDVLRYKNLFRYSFNFFVQVNALIVKYNREQLTVWGNKSSTIVNKAYALVSTGIVLFYTVYKQFKMI